MLARRQPDGVAAQAGLHVLHGLDQASTRGVRPRTTQRLDQEFGRQEAFHLAEGQLLNALRPGQALKLARQLQLGRPGRGHHLRHHHTAGTFAQALHQLHVADDRQHVEQGMPPGCLVGRNKVHAGLARADDDDGLRVVLPDLGHGLRQVCTGNIQGGAGQQLDAQRLGRGLQCRQSARAERVVQVHRSHPAQAHGGQVPDHGVQLGGIARLDVEHVAQARLAQLLRTGKRRNQRHAGLFGQGHARQRRRRAGVLKQRQHFGVFDEVAGVGLGPFRVVGIIERQHADLASMHSALGIDVIEIQAGALAHFPGDAFQRARELARLAQQDFRIGHAGSAGALRTHQGGTQQAQQCGQAATTP